MPTNIGQTDKWLSLGLAFVGGYGDAASFVVAQTFTGHVTGNLVLGAIAVAAYDWRAMLGHLSAIGTFLQCRRPQSMSGFGGIADLPVRRRHVAF